MGVGRQLGSVCRADGLEVGSIHEARSCCCVMMQLSRPNSHRVLGLGPQHCLNFLLCFLHCHKKHCQNFAVGFLDGKLSKLHVDFAFHSVFSVLRSILHLQSGLTVQCSKVSLRCLKVRGCPAQCPQNCTTGVS